MEKEVEINGKKYTIKEMTYVDALSIDVNNPVEAGKITLRACAGLSDEEINKLSVREGIELQKAIDEVNGLQDFRNPTKEDKS